MNTTRVNGSPPPQEPRRDDVPPIMREDVAQLLDVAFAETFAGYARHKGKHGPYWLAINDDTEIPIHGLPKVAGTQFALLEYLEQFCRDANRVAPEDARMVWALNKRPDGDYVVALIEAVSDKAGRKAENIVRAMAIGDDPGATIALTMVKVAGRSMDEMHRELFPHRYIVQ